MSNSGKHDTTMKVALVTLLLATVGWARNFPGDVGTNVINGQDAFAGQFPYMAAIRRSDTKEYQCGGVLLNAHWVVTVANCPRNEDPSTFEVVLGLYDFDDFENGGNPEVHPISQIIQHPDYGNGAGNDIALLQLPNPVAPGNPYIQSAPLAPDDGHDYAGGECYICGWGRRYAGGLPGGVLQYSHNIVLTQADCEARTGWDLQTRLCVYNGYSAHCYDDYGSPLMCRRNSVTYLVGLSTGSMDQCLLTDPGLYTSIATHYQWINSITAWT